MARALYVDLIGGDILTAIALPDSKTDRIALIEPGTLTDGVDISTRAFRKIVLHFAQPHERDDATERSIHACRTKEASTRQNNP